MPKDQEVQLLEDDDRQVGFGEAEEKRVIATVQSQVIMAKKFDIGVTLSLSDQATKKLSAFNAKIGSIGKRMAGIGRTIRNNVTLPVAILGGFAVKAATSMEDAWIGVAKTVNAIGG